MFIDDLAFFEYITDDEVIEKYKELSLTEDSKCFNYELYQTLELGKENIKKMKKSNIRTTLLFKAYYLLYKYNCLISYPYRDIELEETVKLEEEAYKIERECLKFLGRSIRYSEKNEKEALECNNISRTFLLLDALIRTRTNVAKYTINEFKMAKNARHGISSYVPIDININEEMGNIKLINTHTRKLKNSHKN